MVVLVLVGFGAVALKNKDTKMSDTMTTTNVDQTNAASVETNKITYKGFAVTQRSIKVKKGTTVTWTNEDSAKHDVTPDTESEAFKSSELFGKGETYSATFNTVGTYAYHCSPHPYMKGVIEVIE